MRFSHRKPPHDWLAITMAQSTQSQPAPPWTLPPCIAPRLVYPDIAPPVFSKNGASDGAGDDVSERGDGQRTHDKQRLQQQRQQKELAGKDSDPGRMGVWVCLLHGTSILFLCPLRHHATSHIPSSPSNSRIVRLTHDKLVSV